VRATHPEKLIEHAVKGMIPHNRLGRAMITKLKVYAGAVHPHVAQQPEAITLLVTYSHGNSIRPLDAFLGTGRRKTSVARVRLVPGTGKIVINDRTIDEYLTVPNQRTIALQPLAETQNTGKF